MNTSQELAEPLSLKGLLDEALRSARRHLRGLYPAFAVPLAFVGGAIPLAQLGFSSRSAPGSEEATMHQLLVSLVVGFLAMVVYTFAYAAMLIAATDAVAGREVSAARAWIAVFDPRVILTQILVFLVTFVGLVFCILPGFYLGLILTAVIPVIAHEGRYGVGAMRRSVTLMSYNPRHTFAGDPRVRVFLLLFAGGLIGYAASFIVQLPLSVLMMVLMFRAMARGDQPDPEALMQQMIWLQVPSNMLGMLVQTLVFLYMAFGIALLYFDVRRRKEGDDLLAAADSLARRGEPAL
jgi:hypothetical protein